MARTRVRWRRVALTAIGSLMVVGTLGGRAGAGSPPKVAPSHMYVVRQGDTLWAIAVRLVGLREDPRPMVQRLVEANHVRGGLIVPGQELRLP
jgi:nucleoid-associated protein YgaU